MQNHPGALIGLFVGVVLGLAGALGGFGAFLIVLVLGAVGTVVGLVFDGSIDVGALVGNARSARDDRRDR